MVQEHQQKRSMSIDMPPSPMKDAESAESVQSAIQQVQQMDVTATTPSAGLSDGRSQPGLSDSTKAHLEQQTTMLFGRLEQADRMLDRDERSAQALDKLIAIYGSSVERRRQLNQEKSRTTNMIFERKRYRAVLSDQIAKVYVVLYRVGVLREGLTVVDRAGLSRSLKSGEVVYVTVDGPAVDGNYEAVSGPQGGRSTFKVPEKILAFKSASDLLAEGEEKKAQLTDQRNRLERFFGEDPTNTITGGNGPALEFAPSSTSSSSSGLRGAASSSKLVDDGAPVDPNSKEELLSKIRVLEQQVIQAQQERRAVTDSARALAAQYAAERRKRESKFESKLREVLVDAEQDGRMLRDLELLLENGSKESRKILTTWQKQRKGRRPGTRSGDSTTHGSPEDGSEDLPAGWVKRFDLMYGRFYYLNQVSGVLQLEPPPKK